MIMNRHVANLVHLILFRTKDIRLQLILFSITVLFCINRIRHLHHTFFVGLNDNDIANLLDESDLEFASDEDPNYDPPEDRNTSTSSSSDDESEDSNAESQDDEDTEDVAFSVPNQFRGRARTRSCSSRGRSRNRGRGVRTRGGNPVGTGVRTRGGSRIQGETRSSTMSWSRRSFEVPVPQLNEPSYLPSVIPDCSDVNDYVQEYIDDTLITLIVEKSNQSTIARTGKPLRLSVKECKTFIGITLLMSCINYPQIKMYWSRKYAVPIITEAMSRDRFIQLRNSLKFVFDLDVSPEMRQNDKLWKVRPLLDRVLQGCHAQTRDQKISIDEMIIPFTGACPIRQYCPGKPHPTGLKAFVLANPNGLVCDMLIYQGKGTLPDSEYSLGESVVLKLTETLVPGHIIYCDRYFTSLKLIDELNLKGFKCAGTIMKNRIPKYLRDELESDKTLSRRGRGSFDVLVREDGQVAVTKWFDNKPVNMISSMHAAETTDDCRRYDRKQKRYLMVQRPEVVKEYNCNMGGVDLTDRLLAVCPARARTRKWTVRFTAHMIDLAIVNSWIKYRKDNRAQGIRNHKILQLREFKLEVGERMILETTYHVEEENETEEVDVDTRKRGRPPIVPVPPMAKRLHAANHLPDMGTQQKRCRNKACGKKTVVICIYCNMPLCLTPKRNCFVDFHSAL